MVQHGNQEFVEKKTGIGEEVFPMNRISRRSQPAEADLVVGAALIPGANAPKILTGDLLALMKQGSVMVDLAIDQGG
jgi:NAD/NADP transhydrogenase alpha subunit